MKHLILLLCFVTGLLAQTPYKSARFPSKTVLIASASSAPSFRAEAEADGDGAGNLTITKPTGTVNNDFMVALVGTDAGGTSTITPPAGWTSRGKLVSSVDGATFEVFTKLAASEGANYLFTSDAIKVSGFILAYSGVNTTTPLDATTTTATGTGASPVTITGASITTVTTNCKIIWVVGLDANASGDATFTAPASYTLRADATGGGGWINSAAADITQAGTGVSGTMAGSATFTGGSSGWCAFTLALRAQ